MAKKLIADIKNLGEFSVKRILPNKVKKMVGPFIFFDHMGPAQFPAGKGVDVRPHPHIGLATLTYLFDGSILHQDSLGCVQEIFPGDVNWMTAGSGIVHSERETLEVRSQAHSLHGIQSWLALPADLAEVKPSFIHFKKESLPHIYREKIVMRLIAGEAYGRISPVKTYWPMFYLDVIAQTDAIIERPSKLSETAVYILSGKVQIDDDIYGQDSFVILDDEDQTIEIVETARLVLLGGEEFENPPNIRWNFVHFDKNRIQQAEEQWRTGKFPSIPGDDEEFIPLEGKNFIPL